MEYTSYRVIECFTLPWSFLSLASWSRISENPLRSVFKLWKLFSSTHWDTQSSKTCRCSDVWVQNKAQSFSITSSCCETDFWKRGKILKCILIKLAVETRMPVTFDSQIQWWKFFLLVLENQKRYIWMYFWLKNSRFLAVKFAIKKLSFFSTYATTFIFTPVVVQP